MRIQENIHTTNSNVKLNIMKLWVISLESISVGDLWLQICLGAKLPQSFEDGHSGRLQTLQNF